MKYLDYLTLNKIEVFLYTVIFIFIGFGVYFAHTNVIFFDSVYTVEDGLVEWLTVIFLLLGAGVCFGRFYKFKGKKPTLFLTCTFLLGLLFIFGAGEEISWGQRIFGIESPEFFMKYNKQQETNIHNLMLGDFSVNKRIFGLFLGICVAVYVLILPVLYRKSQQAREWIARFALPLPRLVHILLYLLLFIVVSQVPSGKKGELLEFGGTAIFFMIVFFPSNREVFSKL
jgi:CDP-diglyceride synthetase